MIHKLISTALVLSVIMGVSVVQPKENSELDTTIVASATDSIPNQVTNVKSSSVTSTAAKLTWNKVNNAKGYRIYVYNKDTQKYNKVVTIPKNTTTYYKLSGLKEGEEYKYKVRAYRKTNEKTLWGKSSSTVTITTTKNIKFISKAIVYNVPGEGNLEYDSYKSLDSIVAIQNINERNKLIEYIKQRYPDGSGSNNRSKVIKQLKKYNNEFFKKNALIYSLAVTEGVDANFVLGKTDNVYKKQKNNKTMVIVKTNSREIIPEGTIINDEWHTRFNCYFAEVSKASIKNVKSFKHINNNT